MRCASAHNSQANYTVGRGKQMHSRMVQHTFTELLDGVSLPSTLRAGSCQAALPILRAKLT